MKTLNKLVYLSFILATFLVNAQPPRPGDGDGGGGTGPGEVAAPIDMYVYLLSVVAVILIVFFTKKYKSQKI